ncbi:MAG: hypothetical protein DME40_19880 [Verrucomicrobia bacterium]|nr:MAG: hypothetical protein DME40_19880 [Verrucomicrobiota bacterium]
MFDSRFSSLTFQALSISHRAGKEAGESCGANEKFRTENQFVLETPKNNRKRRSWGKQLIARSPPYLLLNFYFLR